MRKCPELCLGDVLRYVSFVAACCVVMIHANTLHVVESPACWNVSFHQVLCCYLTQWAVPYFFAVSGFFFVQGAYVRGDCTYGRFLMSKLRGLLVPYVLWAMIGATALIPLSMMANSLAGRTLFASTALDGGVVSFVDQLFGVVRVGPKHNGPLWFVKVLLILFLFAPIWRLFARRLFGWLFLVIWVAVRFILPDLDWMGVQISTHQVSYFFLGAFLSVYVSHLFDMKSGGRLPTIVGLSFWIYCSHNIILGFVLSFGHVLLGKTNVAIAILTPVACGLAICSAVIVAKAMKRYYPVLFEVLNGHRRL